MIELLVAASIFGCSDCFMLPANSWYFFTTGEPKGATVFCLINKKPKTAYIKLEHAAHKVITSSELEFCPFEPEPAMPCEDCKAPAIS